MRGTTPTALIVGASGFIGKQLVRRFLADGYQVETWDRLPLEPDADIPPGFQHRVVDLLAADPLPPSPEGGWDVVFQLAGESRPSRFVGNQNLRNTVQISARVAAHVARTSAGARYFLNSSAYVYSPSESACAEDSPTEPAGPYGLAKLLSEDVTQIHRDTLHVTIVRPFNLIGAGLPDGLFATDLLERLRSGEGPVQLPTPDSERDMLDIRDAIEAYVALLGSDYESGTVFNFCSGSARPASQLAEALLAQIGESREVRFEGAPGAPLLGSCERLKSITGWAPRCGLPEIAASLAGAQ